MSECQCDFCREEREKEIKEFTESKHCQCAACVISRKHKAEGLVLGTLDIEGKPVEGPMTEEDFDLRIKEYLRLVMDTTQTLLTHAGRGANFSMSIGRPTPEAEGVGIFLGLCADPILAQAHLEKWDEIEQW